MAKINIKKLEQKIENDARQLEIIKAQIEELPLEERLGYAEYVKALELETHKKQSKRKERIKQQKRCDNIRFTWEVIKYVAGALLALVGLWSWVSLFAILG